MRALESYLEVHVVEDEADIGYERAKVESLFHSGRSLSPYSYCNNKVSDDEKDKNRVKMVAGSHSIPKPKSGVKGDQDAHFIHYTDEGRATVGVADGVGGWSNHGIDSGIYARELMNNAVLSIIQKKGCGTGILPLKNILHSAWFKTKAEGASTACILTLADDGVLHATNLGDSGFMVITKEVGGKATAYKSRVQQSGFNCPYQLGRASKTPTTPDQAQDIKFRVRDGDVVVVGTDGLFDNLFPYEIVSIVSTCRSLNGGVLPPATLLARVIANMALEISKTTDSVRPYTAAAVQAGMDRKTYFGGKYDDITVVVGCIGKFDDTMIF